MNHRTAPVEIRERLWFSDDETRAILPRLKERATECVLVSTCNRTELYYLPRKEADGHEAEPLNTLLPLLTEFKNATDTVHSEHLATYANVPAVGHLFQVASGIDSMIVGDVQILNQIKTAFHLAQELAATGMITNRLFDHALHAGKRARTETEIGEGAVSVSYAAAELASKIFSDLAKRSALLIGAGETGKLTARHLASRNLGKLFLANRTRSRSEEITKGLGGTAVDFDEIGKILPHVDIVITAVDVPTHIIDARQVRQTMKERSNRPLIIIDIGVPRNVDPRANTIENVFLHDIDALNQIVDNNLSHRRDEIRKVEAIVETEAAEFARWAASLKLTPTIQELVDQFETIRSAEINKHRQAFSAKDLEEIDLLTKRIINKILHTPLVNLRNGSGEESADAGERIHLIRHLFGLDRKKSPE